MMGITPVTPQDASPGLKYKRKAKFESKVLAWLAIRPKGMTRPLTKQFVYSVNKNTLKKDCIENILIAFIREQYPDDNYVV